MHCNGPCHQGRRDCPCPQACGISPPPSHTLIVRVIVLILVVYLTLLLL